MLPIQTQCTASLYYITKSALCSLDPCYRKVHADKCCSIKYMPMQPIRLQHFPNHVKHGCNCSARVMQKLRYTVAGIMIGYSLAMHGLVFYTCIYPAQTTRSDLYKCLCTHQSCDLELQAELCQECQHNPCILTGQYAKRGSCVHSVRTYVHTMMV